MKPEETTAAARSPVTVTVLVGELAGRTFPIAQTRHRGRRNPGRGGRPLAHSWYAIQPPAGYGPGALWWYSDTEVSLVDSPTSDRVPAVAPKASDSDAGGAAETNQT